ncbi:pilus assembly protein PilM [Verrucomicrobiota bacterium]
MAKEFTTGLVVGDELLEWAVLSRGGRGTFNVLRSGRAEIEGEPAEGEEKGDPRAGAAALIKANLGRSPGRVSLGLPSNEVLMRVVKLPPVDDAAELTSMVELQADKISPFPVEDLVISHEVLQRTDEGITVLVAVAREDKVDAFGETLTEAGAPPARVDVAALGWWRVLADAGAIESEGRRMVVLCDGAAAEIMVFDDGSPVFFAAVTGAAEMTAEEWVAETNLEIAHTFTAVEAEYGSASSRAVSFWTREEALEGLADEIAAVCLCPVTSRSLGELPGAAEGVARRLGAAGGLDLTPASWRMKERTLAFRRHMVAAAALVVGFWALAVGGGWGALYYQQAKLTALEERREGLRDPALEVRGMRRRVFMIQRYMDRDDSALECLREVCTRQPEGVDLSMFEYRKGEVVTVRGEADDAAAVYAFKDGMDKVELFRETTLDGPSRDRKGKENFTIQMQLPEGEQ